MKTLFLIRHAKSSWDENSIRDFERPLNKRGLRDAPFMAGIIKKHLNNNFIIVSSPANRAAQTAAIFAGELNFETDKIIFDERIYEALTRDLFAIIKNCDDKFETVLVFGHNPAITSFANYLGNKQFPNMPTCSIVGINFKIERWEEIDLGSGDTFLFDYPKNHIE